MSTQFSGDSQEPSQIGAEGAPELNRIYTGDCIEVMKAWPENFVDTIITDPPYGLHFMGKSWDKFGGPLGHDHHKGHERSGSMHAGEYDFSRNPEFQTWCAMWGREALRIVKPGGLALVFGGTRLFHRMTSGLEDAGWQIRDCLMWLYGSGFPKSLDISKAIDKAKGATRADLGPNPNQAGRTLDKRGGNLMTPKVVEDCGNHSRLTAPATDLAREWNGWGTALKPAWEPIIVAMKPTDGTFAENAEKWGVAGINVDGGRISTNGEILEMTRPARNPSADPLAPQTNRSDKPFEYRNDKGRWPANLLLDEEAAAMLDGVSNGIHGAGAARQKIVDSDYEASSIDMSGPRQMNRFGDSGGASRFFYVAKSGRAERNEGCEGMDAKPLAIGAERHRINPTTGRAVVDIPRANHHPTVKPLSLMKYLCQLTRTPTGGIVLDPFAGSGTTLWAAEFHNRPWIGIEMNPEYVAIAEARLARERAQIKMAI